MPHSCQSHDADHAELLRHAKLRVTAARIAILDVLCHTRHALDAQEVFERVRPGADDVDTTLDRVTVYRTLTSLADAGIAHRIAAGDRVYRYALAGSSHADHKTAASTNHAKGPNTGKAGGDKRGSGSHSPLAEASKSRQSEAGQLKAGARKGNAKSGQSVSLPLAPVGSVLLSRQLHAHPHFVCDDCGRVECLDELDMILRPADPSLSPAQGEAMLKQLRKQRRIVRQELLLHGQCTECSAKPAGKQQG